MANELRHKQTGDGGLNLQVYIGIKSAKIAHRKMGEALYLIIRKLLFLRR